MTLNSQSTLLGSALTGFAGAAEAAKYQRLAALGTTDAARSQQMTTVSYGARTMFLESWSNLNNWVGSTSTAVQVSGGYVYGNGNGGSSGMNHGLSLAATDTVRIVTGVYLQGAYGGGVGIGISTAASGTAPAGAGSGCYGLYFSTGSGASSMVNGVTTVLGGTQSGLWLITIDIGTSLISVSTVAPNGLEYRWQGARSSYAPNNIWIFNSNSGLTSGSYITQLGSVTPRSTITPRAGYEGLGRTISAETLTFGSSNTTANVKIELPPNYDPRIPSPMIMMFHGNGSNEHLFSDNSAQNALLPALTSAGFLCLSAGLTGNTTSWGCQSSLDAYTAAYRWARDRFNIGPVGFHANSMGGIESELVLAEGRIPNVGAWVGHSPTANLAQSYTNSMFTAPINSSYSISSDGSNYATQTAGHDPVTLPGYAFRGVPMLFLAATDDTTVPKALHTDRLAANVAAYSPEVIVQTGITGGHSFVITPYVSQIVAFFKKYLSDPS